MSLLHLRDKSKDDILDIINLALEFKNGKKIDFQQQKVIVNLFFEPSTRTHYSFDMAAKRLGCQTIDFNPDISSLKKNESFYDTIKFFESIEPDIMIIRSEEDNYYNQFDNFKIPIVNGGDGITSHPTQSLLDLMSIYEKFKTISDLKIMIAGDVKYSRVAHTNIDIFKRLGNEVYLASPEPLQDAEFSYVDFDEYLPQVDVIMLLRTQKERHHGQVDIDYDTYLENHGLNQKRYDSLKEDAIILHPAPVNRGLEIASDLVEADKSYIYRQMNNGLYIRMAVLFNELK